MWCVNRLFIDVNRLCYEVEQVVRRREAETETKTDIERDRETEKKRDRETER